jgi:hypothetical protein
MHKLRQIAFIILFAGWMLPAFLAQSARERAEKAAPTPRPRMGLMRGVEPPPAPADRVVPIFRAIAGIWFLLALTYAGTLAVRLRRTLIA